MKTDIVLINPGNLTSIYQNLGEEFSAIETPSMTALLATFLRGKGHTVKIIDAPAEKLSPEQVAERVNELNPLLTVLVVYGFQPSASTQNMTAAGETAKAIKRQNHLHKIMMTGTHPAALPMQTLRDEAIDFVAGGEGAHEMHGVLKLIKDRNDAFNEVPGLYYVEGETLILPFNSAKPVDDLDAEMPYPAWDLLPMDKYRAHNWHSFENIFGRKPYASIHTTLGCPYKCSFCCINAPFGKPTYRMWKPETIGAQLESLVYAYGVRNIKFVDEMFVLNKDHVLGICHEIEMRGLGDKLNIWAYARVDTVKDEFLEPMRRAGFRWLALGIESASKHVRDGVEKGRFGSEQIIETVRKVQAAGINVIGNYIFGLPDDTMETMQQTLDLALEANCEFANFYSAMAYPGSRLYKEAVANGWKLPEEWTGYSQHSFDTTPLPTETLTGTEVLKFRDESFQSYFKNERYLSMIRQKFGQDVVDHLGRMVAQPLPRKILMTNG